MFCFPNTGHVIILQRVFPFKFHLIHVYIYAKFMKRHRAMFPWDPLQGKQNIQAKEVYFVTTFSCLILTRNYNSTRTVSLQVLTLSVAAEPNLRAIKGLNQVFEKVHVLIRSRYTI